ncbi:glycerophosphodiester phosphodiesterase [Verrucomicrobiota bacterium]
MKPRKKRRGLRIVAHRGASGLAPENTMPAFEKAYDMGVREFETDTQLSTDGFVVLCHDNTLAKYVPDSKALGAKLVEQMTEHELLGLDMGAWFGPEFAGKRILTLDGLFRKYGTEITYQIEIKGVAEGLPAAVVSMIRKHDLLRNCCITSFCRSALARVRELEPALDVGWLLGYVGADASRTAKAMGMSLLCMAAKTMDAQQVSRARDAVETVGVWGAEGDEHQVRQLVGLAKKLGCDKITLDRPDWG